MSKHLNIEYSTFPYEHAICDGAIPQKVSEQLIGYARNIPEESIDFCRNGEEQDNTQMWNNSEGINGIHPEFHDNIRFAMDKLSQLFDDYDSQNRSWAHTLCETNRNFGNFLTPHTDDPVEMAKRNPQMPTSNIKALLYLAEPKVTYRGYGTKLYMNRDRSSFIKEVEFVECRLFMWKTGPNSWHGTDFVNGLPERRLFYTGEYMPISFSEGKHG